MIETPKIVCPICGQEYLPSEIFVPNAFFGSPKEIFKDAAGKIEFSVGNEMDLEEEYCCDNCGTNLKIKANLSFDVEANVEESFEEEYVSTFTKPVKLKLKEVDLFDTDKTE